MLRRPSLETIFYKVSKNSRIKRDRLIKTAVLDYCYSRCEVGDFLGMNYTTIQNLNGFPK